MLKFLSIDIEPVAINISNKSYARGRHLRRINSMQNTGTLHRVLHIGDGAEGSLIVIEGRSDDIVITIHNKYA